MTTHTSKTTAVLKAVWSLISGSNRSRRSQDFRPAINAAKSSPHVPPLNTWDDTAKGISQVIRDRCTAFRSSAEFAVPYWTKDRTYDPWEVFYGAIQFVDDHNAPLPLTILPPQDHVQEYLRRVLASDGKLMLPDQLKLLLDITGNNVLGAANLGFITSRLLSRASDFRPYPAIDAHLQGEDLVQWNNRVAQFAVPGSHRTSDGPGDTYYFWTQFFCAFYYRSQPGFVPRIANILFAYGAPTMRFVRGVIARSPTPPHEFSAHLGRYVGLAAVKQLNPRSSARVAPLSRSRSRESK